MLSASVFAKLMGIARQSLLTLSVVRPRTIPLLLAIAIAIPQLACAATLDSWGYKKQITISNTNVDADLADFPVLVRITADSDMATHAQASGADLRFATSTGMVLPYERENYHVSSGSGSGLFWV